MDDQPNLFDRPEPTKNIQPVDPNVRESDKPRLGRAALAILEQLRSGPATGHDLVPVGGLRYGGRIHDLRQHGYKIDAEHQHDGVWLYSLVEEPT